MKLKLVIGPDRVLSTKSDDIDLSDMANTRVRLDTMINIMNTENGIGLAAPQVGINKRMFVMKVDALDDVPPLCVINPIIEEVSDTKNQFQEGCLSFPGKFIVIERPSKIYVKFIDYHGNERKMELDGINSTCFQHEFDHVNGITILDHVQAYSS